MAPSQSIPLRPLGANGPLLPRMGLGLGGLSGFYGIPAPDSERLEFLSKAYELGMTFWDTADEYLDSEDLLGKWFAANPDARENIFLCTKFGICKRTGEDLASMKSTDEIIRKVYVDSSPEYCRRAIEKSLKRLGVRYVDMYYVHRLDKITPIENTVQAMVDLQREGKIKHIGLSECSAESLRRACKVGRISAVQVEYSPTCTEIETEKINVLATARELGIPVVAYSPLAHGVLTGKLRTKEDFTKPGDTRGMLPQLQEENLERNVSAVDKITRIADAKSATSAQVVLAWVLAQGDDIFPIPGASKDHRLVENLGAFDVQLSIEEQEAVRDAGNGVVGRRMADATGYAFADTPPL